MTHPEEALPSPAGWILAVGVTTFLLGAAGIIGGTHRTWRSVWPWPLAAVPAAVVVAVFPHTSGLLIVSSYACLLAVLAAAGALSDRWAANAGERE